MNLGELIYNLDYNNKKLIRKIENLNKKLNNINNSIVFNELCIKEELLPKFTNIRLNDSTIRNSDITISYR